MMIYVCKHGVNAGLIIESSIDYEAACQRTYAMMPTCPECKKEALAALVASVITQAPSEKI